jgi:hypothetical protein
MLKMMIRVLVIACVCWPVSAWSLSLSPDPCLGWAKELTKQARQILGPNTQVATLMAQLRQESGCRDGLVSRTGAKGPAQFMRGAATHVESIDPELAKLARYSLPWSLRAQSVYMKWIFGQLDAADTCEHWAFALASYNGGLGWTYKRQKMSKNPAYCLGLTCLINPGIKPSNQRENEQYSSRILLDLEEKYLAIGPGACH